MRKPFVPDDLGGEQRVDGQVLRQDLVLADKELAGVLQLDSSGDICGQSGEMKMNIDSGAAKSEIRSSVDISLRCRRWSRCVNLSVYLMKTPCSAADLT